MYNVQARGVVTPNVVVGMALFVGGLAQFVAGMWEFACANAFGATGEWPSRLRRCDRTSGGALPSVLQNLRRISSHSVHHVRRLLDVVRDDLPPELRCRRRVRQRRRAQLCARHLPLHLVHRHLPAPVRLFTVSYHCRMLIRRRIQGRIASQEPRARRSVLLPHDHVRPPRRRYAPSPHPFPARSPALTFPPRASPRPQENSPPRTPSRSTRPAARSASSPRSSRSTSARRSSSTTPSTAGSRSRSARSPRAASTRRPPYAIPTSPWLICSVHSPSPGVPFAIPALFRPGAYTRSRSSSQIGRAHV